MSRSASYLRRAGRLTDTAGSRKLEGVTLPVLLAAYAVGAALLAFWWLVRFPSVGPHRALGALLAMAVAAVGMTFGAPVVGRVAQFGPHGPALAMIAVCLPVLTAAFWAAACMLRVLANLVR
jgi:hypothetical protein